MASRLLKGAVSFFDLLVFYFRIQTHQPISRDPDDQSSFVGAKKLIALFLLASLVLIAAEIESPTSTL